MRVVICVDVVVEVAYDGGNVASLVKDTKQAQATAIKDDDDIFTHPQMALGSLPRDSPCFCRSWKQEGRKVVEMCGGWVCASSIGS